MKKIGIKDKSFWLILSLSIITLIILTVGVIFLTRKSSKEFYSAGYIINSTATKSDKYYFNDNTVYKENVFNEYTFKDVDNKEVATSKENFIHYLDESLSFMKNGVILDLDNFNQKLVPYYNVTDKVILKYSNGGYIVETADKTLIFGNLLGRITDNKYIVIGNDIRIKLAGNEEPVKGKYFELLFVEDGIVKVENNEGSYQTTTEGTTIYVGDKIKIELGSKKVFYDEEEKLTLDEMTIDGNENINLDTSKVKDNKDGNGSEDGTDSNTPNDNNNPNNNDNPGNNTDNPSDNTGNGTDGKDNNTTEIRKEVSVDLVSLSVDINSFRAMVQVIDTANQIKGTLTCTLYNVDDGKEAGYKILSTTSDLQPITFNENEEIKENTNYYMSIKDSDGYEYLARNFRTDNLELSLKREMVTTDSVTYSVDFSGDDNIKSAKVTLYEEDGSIKDYHTFINGEDEEFTFTGLTKNTYYKVGLDEVIYKNTNYLSNYKIDPVLFQTLKEKPKIGNISVKADENNKTFELSMEKPIDEDKSISKYIYKVYEDITDKEGTTTRKLVYTFSTVSLKKEILKLGENGLEPNHNYKYMVTIRYYDNYKENEIDTVESDPFIIKGLPTVKFEDKEISFNSAKILMTLNDEGCTIPLPGRSCYKDNASTDKSGLYVIYKNVADTESEFKRIEIDDTKFKPLNEEDSNSIYTYELNLNGLSENCSYEVHVYGNYDLKNGEGLQINKKIGSHTFRTSKVQNLKMDWQSGNYSPESPISVKARILGDDIMMNELGSFKVKLYKGEIEDTSNATPIASYPVKGNADIKSKYYNNFGDISSSFGIHSIEELKELSDDKTLDNYYTIEIADAYDINEANKIPIENRIHQYEIPKILLLEEEKAVPTVLVENITKEKAQNEEMKKLLQEENIDISYLSSSTIVGYKVTASINSSNIERILGINSIESVNFYANTNGKNIKTSTIKSPGTKNCKLNGKDNRLECTTYFFLKDGTDYKTVDNVDKELRRGNTYTFLVDLNVKYTYQDKELETIYPNKKATSEAITSVKEEPKIKMYIDSSTSNSITYKYIVVDYDNALVKEEDKYLIHYTVGESTEEYTTEISNAANMETFTLSNLTSDTNYSLYWNKALTKNDKPSKVTFNYYFDGYHNASEYGLGYTLDYRDYDNEITLRLNNNDFLDRVSAYLVTLTSDSLKYEEVITTPLECGTEEEPSKCIKIDYANIKDFKGKDVTVKLEAFYDTGYVGFGSKSLLGDYFTSRGLIDDKNASNIGFILQEISNTKGKYYYIYKNSNNKIESVISEVPKGILGISSTLYSEAYKQSQIHITNVVDTTNKKFINYDEVSLDTNVDILTNGIKLNSHNITIAPKLLDKTEIQTTNNKFSFTSIIPKVDTKLTPLINGAIIDINLSIDTDTLETDYIKTNGKYMFYIDIYTKDEEGKLVSAVDPVPTDYEHLTNISFAGLNPDSTYYYKISADMNKNGTKVKTPLFALGKNGYIDYLNTLKTLGKDDIFKNIEYSHKSTKGETVYSERTLNITTGLKSKENFNVRYELYDPEGNLEKWGGTVLNKDITNKNNAIFTTDITGNDFVFGGNYHRLVITAVTTDDEPKELELYNDTLKATTSFGELKNHNTVIYQSTGIDEISGNYDYYIDYNINIEDTDRVIKDGKFYAELKYSPQEKVCPNEEDCKLEIDLYNLKCNSNGANSKIASCTIIENKVNNTFTLKVRYASLKPNTEYYISTSANIYRNNVSLDTKEEVVKFGAFQYTKSELGFSIGDPYLTAVGNNLILKFKGATNNIKESIKGIKYNLYANRLSEIKLDSNEKGLIPSMTSNLVKDAINYGDIIYKVDKDNYPYIEISIPDGVKIGINNELYVIYYYEDNGELLMLSINGETTHRYQVGTGNS